MEIIAYEMKYVNDSVEKSDIVCIPFEVVFFQEYMRIALFMNGYLSVGNCNWDFVKYYMVLIYSYFYRIGKEDSAYQAYIKKVFKDFCND